MTLAHLYAQLIGASAKKARSVWKLAADHGVLEELQAMYRMGGRCG